MIPALRRTDTWAFGRESKWEKARRDRRKSCDEHSTGQPWSKSEDDTVVTTTVVGLLAAALRGQGARLYQIPSEPDGRPSHR